MILDSVKQVIRKTLEERKRVLLAELLANPAITQADLWKNENILSQCREIDKLISLINKALDEKDRELQYKD